MKVGDTVQAGQVVGRLDPTDADAKVGLGPGQPRHRPGHLASDETTYTTDVAAATPTPAPRS